MAAMRHLSIYRGDTYDHTITVVDGTGAAVNLADRTWSAQWRRHPDSTAEVESFAVDATDAATGVLVISLTAAQTATMATSGVWDLQGTFIADGAVETLLRGNVAVTRDVTRS